MIILYPFDIRLLSFSYLYAILLRSFSYPYAILLSFSYPFLSFSYPLPIRLVILQLSCFGFQLRLTLMRCDWLQIIGYDLGRQSEGRGRLKDARTQRNIKKKIMHFYFNTLITSNSFLLSLVIMYFTVRYNLFYSIMMQELSF